MSCNVNSTAGANQLRRVTVGLALVATVLLCLSERAAAEPDPRPGLLGFSPAYPASTPHANLPDVTSEVLFPWEAQLVIDVDSAGIVTGMSADTSLDTGTVSAIRAQFDSTRFHPSTVNGSPSASKVIARLVRLPQSQRFRLEFPLDTTGELADVDLYYATARLNGVQPAGVTRFPRYYSIFKHGDTLGMYPWVLLHLRLDTLGRLREVSAVRSTHPAFTQQIASAAMYARFAPARVRGKAVSSDNWLLVSFFPFAQYPTPVMTAKAKSKLLLLEQLGVRLFADTIGIMSPPVLRGLAYSQVTVPTLSRISPGWVEAQVRVDTMGIAQLMIAPAQRPALVRDLSAILKALRFYPAVDFAGRARDFVGLVKFRLDGSTDIRIECVWLPKAPFAQRSVTTK